MKNAAVVAQEMFFGVLTNMNLYRFDSNLILSLVFWLLEYAQLALFIVDPVWGWDIDHKRCAAEVSSCCFQHFPLIHMLYPRVRTLSREAPSRAYTLGPTAVYTIGFGANAVGRHLFLFTTCIAG